MSDQELAKTAYLPLKTLSNRMFVRINTFFKSLSHYVEVWFLLSKISLLIVSSQKLVFVIFLLGKILRFLFLSLFLFFAAKESREIAGYTPNQVIFFLSTFFLIDALAQFLFREVYRFRHLVVTGDFDLVLIKPVNPLLRVLLGGMDFIDLTTLPLFILAVYFTGRFFNPDFFSLLLYFLMIFNSLIIAAAFHISVLALGIITLNIDHLIMVYRDFLNMGRFSVDIYKPPLKGILTYLIPVGIMLTFPAKVLMRLLDFKSIIASFALGCIFFLISLKFWKFSLKKYTSASS